MYESGSNDLATGYIMGRENNGYNNGGWGFGNGEWIWAIIILALLGNGGWGFGNGFGGGFGGFGVPFAFGNGGGCGTPCATQADVRSAVDQQTLISKIDQQTYGLSDVFNSLNTNLNNNFRGIDNAICNLGYQALQNTNAVQSQLASCCCDVRGDIKDNTTQGVMNTNAIQRQIESCCCDLEKANMQNRFDAQVYNSNTLQAIDKLGDRIDSRLNAMENARVREQLDAERTKNAVLQGQIDRAQLRYDIVNDVRPCPQPAYITCNPYAASYGYNNYGYGFGTFGNNGCGCGCN